jgi:hypothetical protein
MLAKSQVPVGVAKMPQPLLTPKVKRTNKSTSDNRCRVSGNPHHELPYCLSITRVIKCLICWKSCQSSQNSTKDILGFGLTVPQGKLHPMLRLRCLTGQNSNRMPKNISRVV